MRTASSRTRTLAALVATVVLPVIASAQPTVAAQPAKQHVMLDPAQLEWKPAPDVLPPGAQVAVLDGDPTKPGLFTMRIQLPDGYRIQPHFHGADEHVTVVSGTFHVGLGDKWDDAAGTALPAGGFAVMPAGTHHFAWATGETVLQIHAVGPWTLTYVNPADDPRTTKPPDR